MYSKKDASLPATVYLRSGAISFERVSTSAKPPMTSSVYHRRAPACRNSSGSGPGCFKRWLLLVRSLIPIRRQDDFRNHAPVRPRKRL